MPGSSEGRVVFATVKGDIHSIGKDICVSLLESQGFDVTTSASTCRPSGCSKPPREADAVCLSALMTTTLPAMEATVRQLAEDHAPGLPCSWAVRW
jgi:5-methyltetrahydrofolate--homocysteine methyltransferase